MADDKILVRLAKKFETRIFHEFNNDHPHQTDKGGELLVTGGRVAQAARTPGVLHAIMQGVLEEVRDPAAQPTPDPVDVLDVVNGVVTAPTSAATPATPATPGADSATSDTAGSDSGAKTSGKSGK